MARRPSRQLARTLTAQQPRISNLRLTDPIARERVALAFSFDAMRIPIHSVAVAIEHRLGTTTHAAPPEALGVRGIRGTGSLTIDVSRLPGGPTKVTLTPIGAKRSGGVSASVSFEAPSAGGAVPGAIRLRPASHRLTRPGPGDVVHAWFVVGRECRTTDATLFATIAGPDRVSSTLDLIPPAEGDDVVLFGIGEGHALGKYEISSVLVTAAGAIGPVSKTSIELVKTGGTAGPSIASVQTSVDGLIRVRGKGFSGSGLTATVGASRVSIARARAGELLLTPPDNETAPAAVSVRTIRGVAVSSQLWRPPVRVAIMPRRFTLPETGAVQLTALVSGTADQRVQWSITRGQAIARVDRRGRVTGRGAGRSASFVVTARSRTAQEAHGSAVGTFHSHPDRRLGTATIGRLGGSVRSDNGGAILRVPPGALRRPGRIRLETVGRPRAIVPNATRLIIGEVAIRSRDALLRGPARLEFVLQLPQAPGSRASVRVKRTPATAWRDLDAAAIVGLDGHTLSIELTELPARLQALAQVKWDHVRPHPHALGSPLVSSVGPHAVHEGQTVAVLVTGANFVPGLTRVDFVRQDGTNETRIEQRALAITADGTQLGLGLKIGVMTDLPEGQSATLNLKVTTPAGDATSPFSVIGHDELDVLTGARTVSASAMFSRMDVEPGALLTVASAVPPITIQCFERAYIRSNVDQGGGVFIAAAAGISGTTGDVSVGAGTGGAGGSGAGVAGIGSGGAGGAGATGFSSAGRAGAAGFNSLTLSPAGAGGAGGSAGGFGIFPHAGGDGSNGTGSVRSSSPTIDLTFEPSPGGGGGGGGGGEGLVFQTTGGGGGGGGAGGGAAVIAAGEEITLQGDVVAAGGDGGFGAYPFTVTAAPVDAPLISAGRGGGGGSGAGGQIILQGVVWWSGAIIAVSGAPGQVPRYGPLPADARTRRQKLLQQTPTGSIRVDGDMPTTMGNALSGPDVAYVFNLLATTPNVEVTAPGAEFVRVTGGAMQTASFQVPSGPPNRVPITLFPGFNDVIADQSFGVGAPLMTSASIRKRTFLFLPGTIPMYEFACTVSPASATVATERTLSLTASVVARPSTPLRWDVHGGSPAGSVHALVNIAVYEAPCEVPSGPIEVRASSTLDPARFASSSVTIIPGIALSSVASTGTPADPAVPSVNAGDALTVSIPPATYAVTAQGFGAAQVVEFDIVSPAPSGPCQRSRSPFAAVVAPGQTSLQVTVPPCAAPIQSLRVPGHGCLKLQVVPIITSIDPDPNTFPHIFINGSGFDCTLTTVVYISGTVPTTDIISVTCQRIEVATRPASASQVQVRTAGGSSATFLMP